MRIEYARRGGFANIRFNTHVDTESLPPEEADLLRQKVKDAGFFDVPVTLSARSAMADAFEYTITVEDEGRRHTVRITDAAVPESLQPLVQYLTTAAKKRKT